MGSRKISARAGVVARHEVDGFVHHDRHDYEKAADSFYEALVNLLPKHDRSLLLRAAREKTEVLRLHDTVEESERSRNEKLSSPTWAKVREHAESEAELLGIHKAYGFHKAEFYRLHGQGVDRYRDHVYLMEKYFAGAVTGSDYLYLVTAPIYLTCVAFHDLRRKEGRERHGSYAISMMKVNYANYAASILHAMNGRGARMSS